MGLCGDYVLRRGQVIKDGSCRKFVSTANIFTDDYLSVSKFLANNNIGASAFKVYDINLPSSEQATSTFASAYFPTKTGDVYSVIKQIKLVLIGDLLKLDSKNFSHIVPGKLQNETDDMLIELRVASEGEHGCGQSSRLSHEPVVG
jgi:hypothetical protein